MLVLLLEGKQKEKIKLAGKNSNNATQIINDVNYCTKYLRDKKLTFNREKRTNTSKLSQN